MKGAVNYKFGVLYAKEGQMTDDEFYGNGEHLMMKVIFS